MVAYKDKSICERIVERQAELEQIRNPFESCIDQLIDIFRPDMFLYADYKKKPGSEKINILGKKILDGTGAYELRTMADGLQGNLVNESEPWFCHEMEEQRFKGDDDINKWLQAFDEQMYSEYRNSSFYQNLNPFTRNGLCPGSVVGIIEEDDRGKTQFIIKHPAVCWLNQNRFGVTDVLHIRENYKISKAIKIFGKSKFSEDIQYKYENDEDDYVTILRGIYFNLDSIFDELTGFKPNRLSEWTSIYTEERSSEQIRIDKQKPLKVEPYYSKPFVVWHYDKDPSLVYSFTPAWYSYYDLQSLQQIRKSLIKAAQKMTEEAWWAPAYLRGQAQFYPKGFSWYQPAEKEMKPENLFKDIKPPEFALKLEETMQETVKRWFFADMWMILNRIALERKQPITIFHLTNIMGERALLLAPRVNAYLETIREIDDRFVEIMQRRGKLPQPIPDIILSESNRIINPVFIGPLVQIQKQYQTSKRLETTMAMAEPILRLDPMTRYKFIAEKLMEKIMEENRFYQDCIRSDDEYKELIKAISEQMAAEKALSAGKLISDTVPKLSGAVEENSPLAMATEAA